VFKRRQPLSLLARAREMIYPTGGFKRAARYMMHRMRRLPDEPHRVARGVFAGTFVNFPPIFGFQFLGAAGLAWLMRGNILAALLATFLSNPFTTPIIAVGSLELGHWMLGTAGGMDFTTILSQFTGAGGEIWHNISAIFTAETARWGELKNFFWLIYWPYFVGSLIPGLIVSMLAYWLTLPAVKAYQTLKAKKARERIEKLRRRKAASVPGAAGDGPAMSPACDGDLAEAGNDALRIADRDRAKRLAERLRLGEERSKRS
jgi:uncharacterized protein (DUF2062 family)